MLKHFQYYVPEDFIHYLTRTKHMKRKPDSIHPDLNRLQMPIIKELGLVHSLTARNLPWHVNRGFELTYAYSGEFIWEIEQNSCRERLQLTGGVLGLTPPDLPHRGYDSLIAPGELLYIVFDPETKGAEIGLGMNPEELKLFSGLWNGINLGTTPVDSKTETCCRLLASIMKEQAGPGDKSLKQCELRNSILQVLLTALSCFIHPGEQKRSSPIAKACQFMEMHSADNLTVHDMAFAAGLGKTRFFELFIKEKGQTPGNYFNRLRCRKACTLLRKADLPITEIAFNCGYSSSQYFATCIRKYTGCSPSEYRRRIVL